MKNKPNLLSKTVIQLLLFLFVSNEIIYAQPFSVTGKVTDTTSGQAIPGVIVTIQGTNKGTTTDQNGFYTITVSEPNSILVFSSIGYTRQTVPVNGQMTINLTMVEYKTILDEIVIIGYGVQKRGDLTGSIAIPDMKDLSKIATNDVTKAIQGRVPGVSVQSGGEPGALVQIQIRGYNTFGAGTPLYIVDGIYTPINDIPVSDIESIQILKDASASAIYGSRAANGVVIITTKRGQSGKLKVEYNGYYGIQNIVNRYDVANREEYQLLLNEANDNAGIARAPGNDPASPLYIDSIDTDWQKESFKTGSIQEHSLTLSGGNEHSVFSTSMNYFNHQGTLTGPAPNLKRYAFSMKSDHHYGKFKFGGTAYYSIAQTELMTHLHDGQPLYDMIRCIPTIPVYDENRLGGYGGTDNQIHVAFALNVIGVNNLLKASNDRNRFLGGFYGEYELFAGLKYKVNLGYETTWWRDFYFEPKYDLGWFYQNTISKLSDYRGNGWTTTLEQTVTYDKIFGRHHITAMIGNTILSTSRFDIRGHSEELPEPYSYSLSQGISGISVTSEENHNRLLSYFGRLIYNFDDRYFLTSTLRRDGSSRFGKEYRWGNFPSVAVAWKISSEQFMESIDFISQLKIRASYGTLDNQEIANYLYSTYVDTYAHAVFNGVLAPGSIPVNFGTPDIHWEEQTSMNIGIDIAILKNSLTFSAEYFNNITDDMLVRVSIPPSTGVYEFDSPTINGASIENRGFEFMLDYSNMSGDFKYSVNANFSTLKNEVLSLGYGDRPIYGTGTKTAVGGEVGQFYGFVIEKIFQDQEEIDGLDASSPTSIYQSVYTSPGDLKFKDLNFDGRIDEDGDRTYLGSAIPKYYYGATFAAAYKDFDFTLGLRGVAGNKIFNYLRAVLEGGGGYTNFSENSLNRWTPSNPHTDVNYPRLITNDPNANYRMSERWLESGNYLKINTIQLGYTIKSSLLSKVKISSLRIYATGQNVFTFTKYTGFDPDFGYEILWDRGVDHPIYPEKEFTRYMGGLPNPRTLLLGIQLAF